MSRRHVISCRLDDDQLAFLDRRASAQGMTRSAYARAVLGGTGLGEHFVGKVETATPGKARNVAMDSHPARSRSGIAVVIRPEQPRRRALRAVPPEPQQ